MTCKCQIWENGFAGRQKQNQKKIHPVVNFWASRWPPQKSVAHEIDRTQASMVACISRVAPLPGELPANFCRRRMKAAHFIASSHGKWSSRWFNRFDEWNDLLDRHPSHPCSRLLQVRNSAWMRERRATFAPSNPIRSNSWSMEAGRSDTRACSGFVVQRWEVRRSFSQFQRS